MRWLILFVFVDAQEAASCRIEMWSNRKCVETLRHEPRKSLVGHGFQVIDLRVVEEEGQLISSDYSGELRIWDLSTLTIRQASLASYQNIFLYVCLISAYLSFWTHR